MDRFASHRPKNHNAYMALEAQLSSKAFSHSERENGVDYWTNKKPHYHMHMGTCILHTRDSLTNLLTRLLWVYQQHAEQSSTGQQSLLSLWDPKMLTTKIIDRETNNLDSLVYVRYKSPKSKLPIPMSVVKDRDFVFFGHCYEPSAKRLVYVMTSADGVLNNTDAVRGDIMCNAWVFEQLEPGKVLFSYVVHVNPAGNVPVVAVNMVAAQRVKWMSHMKRFLEQWPPIHQ